MHADAREYDRDPITADVCVVGAGAAGITLALTLADTGLRTVVLESGGLEREPETDRLNEAHSPSIDGDYLAQSRVRVFGGTTSHWTGLCLPLDDPTFEVRSWVPHSGWPIDGDTLHPFYQRACAQIGIEPWERSGALPLAPDLPPLRLQPDGKFRTRVYQVERNAHFGERYGERLKDSEDVLVLTHATCTELRATDQRVDRAVVRTLTDKRMEVHAKVFVLATGGIENPRLLLLSTRDHPKGLGNGHDLVGRYYMDHPELMVGEAMLWPGWALDLYYGGRLGKGDRLGKGGRPGEDRRGFGALFPTRAHQQQEGLLQAGIQLIATGRRWGIPAEAAIDRAVCAAGFWFDCHRGVTLGDACLPTAYKTLLFARSEQAPDPANRVVLGDGQDALGGRLPTLQWSMSELDRTSLRRTAQALGHAFYRSGVGRFRPYLGEDTLKDARAMYGFSPTPEERDRISQERQPLILVWGHHMGTTRMADSPTQGVVDRDCRVHGLRNLFMAGSSVFPTGGAANPTLTIVALALRLGDHLHRALRDSGAG